LNHINIGGFRSWPEKTMVPVLVVDSIERLTEN